MRRFAIHISTLLLLLLNAGCGGDVATSPERYAESDSLFSQVEANVAANPDWSIVTEIDHSRLGAEAGSSMPPARVLIFSNPSLEAALLQLNPLVGLDLPMRVLAYEESPGASSKVIFNSYEFLQSRYGLPAQAALAAAYNETMAVALQGLPAQVIGSFESDSMDGDGIITIASPYDFDQTMERVQQAIASQDDTVSFGVVDFQQLAAKQGVDLAPSSLILFGGPAPGAKAMSQSPTLGLDAFCQKFLVWQDADGKVKLSFNDLLALAERQGAAKSIPLRVINFRLTKLFADALAKSS